MGTKLFVEELSRRWLKSNHLHLTLALRRFFSSCEEVVTRVTGKQLTLPYLNQVWKIHDLCSKLAETVSNTPSSSRASTTPSL